MYCGIWGLSSQPDWVWAELLLVAVTVGALPSEQRSCKWRASCSCCAAKRHIQVGGKVGCGVTSCYLRPLLVLILHIPDSKQSRVKRSNHNAFWVTKPLSCYAGGLSLKLMRRPLSSVL